MKRILALSILSLFLLFYVGCEEEVVLSIIANLGLSAANDEVSVELDWDASPSGENIDGYIVYFNTAAIETTTNNEYTHTNPQESGDYYVTAYRGSEESDPSSTESTTPVLTTNVQLYELSVVTGESGFGWNITSGQGTIYSMADDTHAASIDLYFTDYAVNYAGPYDISSPDRVTGDPGANLGGTSGWKTTGFTELTDDFDDVTTLPTTGYFDVVEDVAENAAYGVYTDDGYYAIVEVQSINYATGMVQIRTAFQTVPGLAILEH